jgi:hypothetical protein
MLLILLCYVCYVYFVIIILFVISFNVLSCNVVLRWLYLAEFNEKSQGKNGKFQVVERTPTEKYFFRRNHWKTPSWRRIINGKFLFV